MTYTHICRLRGSRETGRMDPFSFAALHVSLSRLNHRLPGREAHPEVVQGTAEFHHEIADALLPQADQVFHNATALDTAVDMLDPQPTLVQRLGGQLLLAWTLGHKSR